MGSTLPGLVCILSSSSLPQYWASSSFCMAYLPWMPTCQGKHIHSLESTLDLVKMTIYHRGIHGYAVIIMSYFSQETCDDNLNITMCPLCDGVCDYWHLSTVCSLAQASYLFDNGATVLFAIFMSLWGTYILYITAPAEELKLK